MDKKEADAIKQANELMYRLRVILPQVDPVTLHDIHLFNYFFALEREKGKEAHSDSFSYMLQMMNSIGESEKPKLGYRFFDGQNLIPISTYPLKSDPSKIGIFILRPMGERALQKVVELSKQLREHSFNEPIFVKKLFKKEAEALCRYGFSPIETFPWHERAIREDDTLPEQLFDLCARE